MTVALSSRSNTEIYVGRVDSNFFRVHHIIMPFFLTARGTLTKGGAEGGLVTINIQGIIWMEGGRGEVGDPM